MPVYLRVIGQKREEDQSYAVPIHDNCKKLEVEVCKLGKPGKEESGFLEDCLKVGVRIQSEC
jgi:hypothetical protein